MIPRLEITAFQKLTGPLSKRIFLQDGKVVSDGSACTMSRGTGWRITLDDVHDLVALISRCRTH